MHLINDISEITVHNIEQNWYPTYNLKKVETAILYVRKGYGDFVGNEERFSLNQGDLFTVSAADHEALEFYISPVKAMEIFAIKYTSASIYRLNDEWAISEIIPKRLIVKPLNRINHGLVRFHQDKLYKLWESNEKQQGNSNHFQNHFDRMLMEINKLSSQIERKQENLLEDIKSYIDRHFDEVIQVNDLVKSSGLNLTTFYKEFKDGTGYPPLQYITNKRIAKAKQLLLSTPMQLNDVASEVGYHDVYYFSRVFKRAVGVSPQKFAALCKKRIFVLTPAFAADLLALGISKDLLYPFSPSTTENFLMNLKKRKVDPEEISLIKPECILGHRGKESILDQLQEVAPTLLISYKKLSWREQLLRIAEGLGSEEMAVKWLDQYDRRLENVRESVKNKIGNDTFLAVRVLDEKVRIFGDQRRKLSEFLYCDLELNAPDFVQGIPYFDVNYDSVELGHLDAKHILLLTDQNKYEQTATLKRKINGNIYEVNSFPWLSYSAWGHEKVLTEALEILV